MERIVALKILPADVASDSQRMRRFIQEAKAASALNHQNIITIYEIGHTDAGTHFIATEFINGTTLRQHMANTRMKTGEVLEAAVQIASALAAAHEAGIVHRDIKPENVMLRADGFVKVLDFGLVKLTERQPSSIDTEASTRALVNTEAGVVMGTASYMSPEQARGLLVDARTDIWSLGTVIYEMAAGRVPFGGDTITDVIASIVKTPYKGYGSATTTLTDQLFRTQFERWGNGGDYMGFTADVQGMFHPFWIDSRSGTAQVWTTGIQVVKRDGKSASIPSAPLVTVKASVNDKITLVTDPPSYDAARQEAIIPIRLKNISVETIYGPLTVEVKKLAEWMILNAGNGKEGVGAVFDYSSALGDWQALRPGAFTEAVEWRFKYSGLGSTPTIGIEVKGSPGRDSNRFGGSIIPQAGS